MHSSQPSDPAWSRPSTSHWPRNPGRPASTPPGRDRPTPPAGDFRRTVVYTIAGTALPGLGLIAAKRRIAGGIILGLFLALLATLAVWATLDLQGLVSLAVRPAVLRALTVGLILLTLDPAQSPPQGVRRREGPEGCPSSPLDTRRTEPGRPAAATGSLGQQA